MSKLKLYREMENELLARKNRLERDAEQLRNSADRLAEIDADIAVIDSELAEYQSTPEIKEDNARKEREATETLKAAKR